MTAKDVALRPGGVLVGQVINPQGTGQAGSVATLICDGGERYLDTCYNPDWIAREALDLAPHTQWLTETTGI